MAKKISQPSQSETATVKIETEKDSPWHHQPNVKVLLQSDDLVREQMGGFANFLREYAVIGLAIGFVVGQQANAVAKSVVDTFMNPWIQILFGQKLSARAATFHHNGEPVKLPWGAFVYTLIEFFFVLIVIYLLIKLFRLDKLKKADKKK